MGLGGGKKNIREREDANRVKVGWEAIVSFMSTHCTCFGFWLLVILFLVVIL